MVRAKPCEKVFALQSVADSSDEIRRDYTVLQGATSHRKNLSREEFAFYLRSLFQWRDTLLLFIGLISQQQP